MKKRCHFSEVFNSCQLLGFCDVGCDTKVFVTLTDLNGLKEMNASVTWSDVSTPIGVILLRVSEVGIREISLDREYNSKISTFPSGSSFCVKVLKCEGPQTRVYKDAIKWLEAFFDPTQHELAAPPIDNEVVSKNNFTGHVLRSLMRDTQPGVTISYAGLARHCGSPKACRAVGQAMRANPIPLVVPCHRVVGSNGKLGHYMSGSGNDIKRWLLRLEEERSKK